MIWDRLREKIIYLIPRWQPPQQLLLCFATRAPASGWRWRWSYAPRVMRLWWPYLVCRPQRGAGGRTSPCRSKKSSFPSKIVCKKIQSTNALAILQHEYEIASEWWPAGLWMAASQHWFEMSRTGRTTSCCLAQNWFLSACLPSLS